MCTQSAVSDRRAPGEQGCKSDVYFGERVENFARDFMVKAPTAEDEEVKKNVCESTGLWEMVTLCHTLLALDISLWLTNKTGG